MTRPIPLGREEENPVRNVLGDLPKVSAPPDFEVQLQRKIAQESSTEKSLLTRIFSLRRTPAFAYSLMTIILVGAIAYYMLIRTGQAPIDTPVPILQETPRREQARVPELRQGRAEEESPKSIPETNSESRDATQGVKVFKMAPPVREIDKSTEQPLPQEMKNADRNALRSVAQPTTQSSEIISAPSRSDPGAQLKDELHLPVPTQETEGIRSLQKREMNLETRPFTTPLSVSDSMAKADSVRMDSIKRFRNQVIQQKAPKKPSR